MRFLAISIYSLIAGLSAGKLDISTSLFTGNFAFKNIDNTLNISGIPSSGASFGRAFTYIDDNDKFHYIAHEIIHQFQFDQYQSLNSYLIPIGQKFKLKGVENVFSKYVYLDIPYFWLGYSIKGNNHSLLTYYRNFYEFEAESLSSNKFVKTR